jgi:hypothetical protein
MFYQFILGIRFFAEKAAPDNAYYSARSVIAIQPEIPLLPGCKPALIALVELEVGKLL